MGPTSPMLRGQSSTQMMVILAAWSPDALNAVLSHRGIQSKLPREAETQSTSPLAHTVHTLLNYRGVFWSLATFRGTGKISEYRGTK